MNILGLNCYIHDAAASLLVDGEIACALEEERLTREKHTGAFPARAIEVCLKQAGIDYGDIDHSAFYWDPWMTLRHRLFHAVRFFPKSLWVFRDLLTGGSPDTIRGGLRAGIQMAKIGRELRRTFGDGKRGPRLHYVPHHFAHAASAFFVSPFERSAIWTVDGTGESCTSMLAQGEGTKITALREVPFPHSLGALYGAVTQFLGFQVADEEWKVMGLASYGEPRYQAALRNLIKLRDDGTFRLDLRYFHYQYMSEKLWFSPRMQEILGPPRAPDESLLQPRFADIAASVQGVLEEVALHMLRHLHEICPDKRLVIAGGVGLNCAMNATIREYSPFEQVFVQPASHDSGCSLGAALYVAHQVLGHSRQVVLRDVYLGSEYSPDEIVEELRASSLEYSRPKDLCRETAQMLARGLVVGWFQGRMEFGPRALGNRSILADPRESSMRDRVNAKVKFRETFRPFAPAVLSERSSEFFEDCADSPFMLFLHRVRPEHHQTIAAVTHVDGTARVQTVERETNPRFHDLIAAFGEITGVPVLLNTSFNVAGEPIVCSPRDAIRCFEGSGLDALVLGDWVATKSPGGSPGASE